MNGDLTWDDLPSRIQKEITEAKALRQTAIEADRPESEIIEALKMCMKELAAWMKDHGHDRKTQDAIDTGWAAIRKSRS